MEVEEVPIALGVQNDDWAVLLELPDSVESLFLNINFHPHTDALSDYTLHSLPVLIAYFNAPQANIFFNAPQATPLFGIRGR